MSRWLRGLTMAAALCASRSAEAQARELAEYEPLRLYFIEFDGQFLTLRFGSTARLRTSFYYVVTAGTWVGFWGRSQWAWRLDERNTVGAGLKMQRLWINMADPGRHDWGTTELTAEYRWTF